MDTLTIYGFAPSTYTRTARMAALEKGAAHELQPIAYGEPEHFKLHPFGKMPIMRHGDVTLFETLAITAYIDKTFGAPSLFAPDPIGRARILSAISVAIDYAYRPVVHGSDAELAAKVLDIWNSRLAETPMIAGEVLSAADLFCAPMIAYHAAENGDEALYTNRPHLKAWMDIIATRPSFKETEVQQNG